MWILVTNLFWNLVRDSFFRTLIKDATYMEGRPLYLTHFGKCGGKLSVWPPLSSHEVDDKTIENKERRIITKLQ